MPRTLSRLLAIVALMVAALSAVPCQSQVEMAVSPARPTLEQVLSNGRHPLLEWQGMDRHLPAVRSLYEGNGWALAWSRDGAATPQAVELLGELRDAAHKGLIAEDYFGLPLTYLLIDLMTSPRAGTREWALWDAGLSAALSRYVSDLHYGRVDAKRIQNVLKVDRARLDIGVLLTGLTQSRDPLMVIADVEPSFRTYEYLKRALARYRELSMERDLTDLPPLGRKSLRAGDAWPGAGKLRTLLVALGDLPVAAAPVTDAYTAELASGIARFQSRHGLEADGALGPATFRNLTTPLSWRVKQIELAMERWRWVPSPLDSAPIIVNIPQFRLFAFEGTEDDPSRMVTMEVIVGNAYREHYTPVFAADLTHIVFRPYWDVPRSIAVKELLPDIRRKPGYMEKEEFEIVAGPSDSSPVIEPTDANLRLVAAGKARLRQKPGPKNALGLVKFMLPNPYNVYLHDTPAQSLFTHSRRDFSHGCVRVSNPVGLAEYVLRDEPGWTRERIEAAMQAETSETARVTQPIRVFFVYGTATATEDRVYFFEDIYGQDQVLDEECRCANRPSAAQPPGGPPRVMARPPGPADPRP